MAPSSPDVSVLIPVYNGETYLGQCLDSVVNQSLRNIEIIIIDDGSTDGSHAIIESYQRSDDRVRVVTKSNSGYGDSLNIGLDSAVGEYISIVESDDIVPIDFLEQLHSKAVSFSPHVDIIKSDYEIFATDSRVKKGFRKAIVDDGYYDKLITEMDPEILLKADVHNWNGIYRRDFLNSYKIRHNTTPGASYQDTGFRFQYLTRYGSILFFHGPRYQYRVDNSASSIRANDSKVFAIVDEYSFIEKYLKDNSLTDVFGSGFSINRYRSYKWNFNSVSKSNKRIFLDRWREQLSLDDFSSVQKELKQRIDEWMVTHLPNSVYIATAGTAHDILLKLNIITDV